MARVSAWLCWAMAASGVAAASGDLVWSYQTEGVVTSSPALSGGRVFFGSHDGSVYCLDAADGGFVWSYQTGHWVYSSPAVVGGRVYVGGYDARIYCVQAPEDDPGEWPMFRRVPQHTGTLPWQVDLHPGWNLIGYGRTHFGAADLALVTVSDGRTIKTWDQAVSAGWVHEPAYYYEAGLGYLTLGTPAASWDSGEIRPGLGYWILVPGDEDLLLQVR